MKIQVILGSAREERNGIKVFEWVKKLLSKHKEAEFEFIDLLEWNLPFYNDATSPLYAKSYDDPLITKWSKKIASADGYIIVTPEYNHGYPAVLKNALDHLYHEWVNKPVAFIGYGGSSGGSRAIEQLRQVVNELQMAPIRESILITAIWGAFDEKGDLKDSSHATKLEILMPQLLWWTKALKTARLQSS
jgi:NAD(P)H-dependent FMN reductase